MDDILQEWYDVKMALKQLERRNDEIRRELEAYMKANRMNSIVARDFVVARKTITRFSINKDDVPVQTWNRYATGKVYDTLHLTPL